MATESSQPQQPLLSIEGLRFIASIAIVFTHFAPYALKSEPFDGRIRIFVDIFFVISGIVITTAYGKRVGTLSEYGLYMQRRIARLYPLHLATMLFYIAIALAAVFHVVKLPNPDRYAWDQLPLYLTMTQAWFGNGSIAWNSVSWSISAELAIYLAFPLIIYVISRGSKTGAIAVVVSVVITALAARLLLHQDLIRLASKCSWLRALPSFAAGVWLARNSVAVKALPAPASRTVLHVAFLLLAALVCLNGPSMALLACAWIIVASAYACDLNGVSTIPSAGFISRHGNLTYSLYLIHPMIATAWLAFIAPRMSKYLFGSMWLAVALGFAMTFVLSYLSFRFYEEPARRVLGRSLFKVRDARRGALN